MADYTKLTKTKGGLDTLSLGNNSLFIRMNQDFS